MKKLNILFLFSLLIGCAMDTTLDDETTLESMYIPKTEPYHEKFVEIPFCKNYSREITIDGKTVLISIFECILPVINELPPPPDEMLLVDEFNIIIDPIDEKNNINKEVVH